MKLYTKQKLSFHFIENILRCNLCFKKCVLLQFLVSDKLTPIRKVENKIWIDRVSQI